MPTPSIIEIGGKQPRQQQLLDGGFVRRAMGAVVAAPGAAADVLRALLACPASVLLSRGEEALKAVLPKVSSEFIGVCCYHILVLRNS